MRPALAVVCLAILGCELPSFRREPAHPADHTIHLGARLLEHVRDFAWAPDGRELYAMTWYGGVWAVNPATDSARLIDSLGRWAVAAAPGASGSDVYYVRELTDSDGTTIRRQLVRVSSVPASIATVLLDRVGLRDRLAVSSDGAYVALTDAVMLITAWNLRTGAAFTTSGTRPLSFAPSGGRLAYTGSSGCRTLLADVDSGTARVSGLDEALCAHDVGWDRDSLRAVGTMAKVPRSRGDTIFTARPLQPPVPVYVLPFDDYLYDFSLAWSADLAKVAIWYDACGYRIPTFDNPAYCAHTLYVLDVASGTARWVAGSIGWSTKTVFSPDARSVAYLFGDTLFVSTVP